ncbi:MAG: tRNA (adenosine(37)-N6)-threonylcarbamoyltransferase complex dimerization subunit type 1 TsaB [Verrucomicrobia bacterium]|nr:tRNA (adenosine(37)-N6)-threonylcarbamoyltransferase complex dimerization subunit type 1 TsaB [Verrucomicrobiota bacterium]
MKALIFETSTEKSCLILAENGSVRKKKFLSGGPELSKTLAREVDTLLDGPVDFISVGQGPGSYTGTRVGAALAQGLSFGWQIPLYGFCSLIAFAPPAPGPFTVLVDARMGGFYILTGERSSSLAIHPPKLVQPSEAPLIGTLASPHPAQIARRLPSIPILETSPCPDLLAAWAFANQSPLTLSYLSNP